VPLCPHGIARDECDLINNGASFSLSLYLSLSLSLTVCVSMKAVAGNKIVAMHVNT